MARKGIMNFHNMMLCGFRLSILCLVTIYKRCKRKVNLHVKLGLIYLKTGEFFSFVIRKSIYLRNSYSRCEVDNG